MPGTRQRKSPAPARPARGTKAPAAPTTVDGYLAALSGDKREALERLRRIIRAVAPGIEEAISYHMVGFRLAGKWLLWIGASAKHCAVYGVSETRAGELAGYDTSGRGTIRFAPDQVLPAALVRKQVKARIAHHAGKGPAPRTAPTSSRAFRSGNGSSPCPTA